MQTLIISISQKVGSGYPISVILRNVATPEPASVSTVVPGLPIGASHWTIERIKEKFLENKHPLPRPEQQAIGALLTDFLRFGPLAAAWPTVLGKNTGGCRILLNIEAAELRTLPWELMLVNKLALAVSPLGTVCRGTLPPEVPLPFEEWPIRCLIVVGDPSLDKAKPEVGSIEHLSHQNPYRKRIDIEVLMTPTRASLQQSLRLFRPHVLHFIGHGGLDTKWRGHLVLHAVK